MAKKVEAAQPAYLRLRYYTADETGPKPAGTEVIIRSEPELAKVLGSLKRSDRNPTESEALGIGKDNMVTLDFYDEKDNRLELFHVMTSQIDRWGPSVRRLLLTYLPKTVTLTGDGRLIPKGPNRG
jgi:hypothetical protein